MKITSRQWSKYIKKLAAINEKAGTLMSTYIQNNGMEDTQKLIAYAYYLVEKYGSASAELSCVMYDELAELSGARVPPAQPAPTASYKETAIAVSGTKMQGEPAVQSAVVRLVKMAGQDTTLSNALRDGAEWAWIPQGDTCSFCITLASRGWQTASNKAINNGHAEHIHAHCDCAYAIRFNSKTDVDGYDPDKYLDMYYDADRDINAMRREQYESRKDLINSQKRARYAEKHPVRGSTDTGEAIVMSDGQRIPYGNREGFSGMSREEAINQAKKYNGNKNIK